MPWQARALALSAGFDGRVITQVVVFSSLFRLFKQEDAELAEINPLMLTKDGKVVAADAKITLDDNALSGIPDTEAFGRQRAMTRWSRRQEGEGLHMLSSVGGI